MKQTQNISILRWLKTGHSLTAMDALREFGCFRLAARIYDLRDAGHKIAARLVATTDGKHIARYVLLR